MRSGIISNSIFFCLDAIPTDDEPTDDEPTNDEPTDDTASDDGADSSIPGFSDWFLLATSLFAAYALIKINRRKVEH
ncbi:MAG: hypothetical protein ACTSRK_13565 [Promethearchaeota archaeon]